MSINFIREFFSSPVVIINNILTYKHLVIQMIKQDIRGRFAGTAGGVLWNLVDPVAKLLVYLFVFVFIFKLRVGQEHGAGYPAIFIVAGLFPWLIMSEGMLKGASSLLENANLIKKSSFPIEILVARSVFLPFFSHGIVLLLLVLYQVFFNYHIKVLFIVPLIFILQILFTMGCVFFSTVLSIFFRDIIHLHQVMINLWIFLTPIFYHVGMLPEWGQKLMYINPVYPFISAYQCILSDAYTVQWHMLFISFIWTAVVFVAGSFIFIKLKDEFADWL